MLATTPSRRGRRPQADDAEEARALVAAAERVMGRKGFEAATVVDILTEAGVSTRAFYRHFKSKDELLLAIYEKSAVEVADVLHQRTQAGDSPRQALVVWVDEMLSFVYDARRRSRALVLMTEAMRFANQHPGELERILERMLEPLRLILERGLDEGEFPLADPATDARLIFALVTTVTRARLQQRTKLDREQARARVLRFALAGLGAA